MHARVCAHTSIYASCAHSLPLPHPWPISTATWGSPYMLGPLGWLDVLRAREPGREEEGKVISVSPTPACSRSPQSPGCANLPQPWALGSCLILGEPARLKLPPGSVATPWCLPAGTGLPPKAPSSPWPSSAELDLGTPSEEVATSSSFPDFPRMACSSVRLSSASLRCFCLFLQRVTH